MIYVLVLILGTSHPKTSSPQVLSEREQISDYMQVFEVPKLKPCIMLRAIAFVKVIHNMFGLIILRCHFSDSLHFSPLLTRPRTHGVWKWNGWRCKLQFEINLVHCQQTTSSNSRSHVDSCHQRSPSFIMSLSSSWLPCLGETDKTWSAIIMMIMIFFVLFVFQQICQLNII